MPGSFSFLNLVDTEVDKGRNLVPSKSLGEGPGSFRIYRLCQTSKTVSKVTCTRSADYCKIIITLKFAMRTEQMVSKYQSR